MNIIKLNDAILFGICILLCGFAQANNGQVFEIFPSSSKNSCNEQFENIANTLQPGDELILHGGIYMQNCRRAITVKGTPHKPIIIRAAEGETPVLTRPQEKNHRYKSDNLEIVDSSHLVIKGIHFQGGDNGVRFIKGNNIIFEHNEIEKTGNSALTMDSGDTKNFILRNNHIHEAGLLNSNIGNFVGEGISIGCKNAQCSASNHIIENNYIHSLKGTSGGKNDAIEIKPGSYGNIVRNNVVYNTAIKSHLLAL